MAGLFERMGLVRTEYEGMPEIPMQPVSEPMYAPETPVRQHGASCQILATLAPAASGGGTEMNFKQFIRWRLVCFVQTHIRHCQECLGSNGHCQECNDWHHLFRRDWQRTYWRRKC